MTGITHTHTHTHTHTSFETFLKLYFHCGLLKKAVVGYIDLEQKETYKKLKNRGWYSKWYWYFNNATTSNDNKNDDNTLTSTVTATVSVNH